MDIIGENPHIFDVNIDHSKFENVILNSHHNYRP